MATTFVRIDTNQRLGQEMRNCVDDIRRAKEKLGKLKVIMDTQVDASDYTLVESQFGVAAGQGVTLYNLAAGLLADISGANYNAFTSRCG